MNTGQLEPAFAPFVTLLLRGSCEYFDLVWWGAGGAALPNYHLLAKLPVKAIEKTRQ